MRNDNSSFYKVLGMISSPQERFIPPTSLPVINRLEEREIVKSFQAKPVIHQLANRIAED